MTSRSKKRTGTSMRREPPLYVKQLRDYTKNLFEVFHRERLPMPDSVTMAQDPQGEPGVPLLCCKFPDRSETWETVRVLNDIVGWRRKLMVPLS